MKFLAKVIWLALLVVCWLQQEPARATCETYRGVVACWEVRQAEPVSTFLGITALFGLSTTTAAIVGGAIVSFGVNIGLGLLQRALAPKPKLASELGNRLVTVRQAISYRRWVSGTVGKLAGIITFFHQAQVGGAHYDYVVVTLSGRRLKTIGNLYFDDELVPLDGSGSATGKYAGLVKVEKNLGGDDQAALSLFTTEVGAKWTSAHRQRGCAHAGLRLKFDQDKLPFLPNIRFDVEGPEWYDPRTGTLVFTANAQNAALLYADYLTDIVLGPGYSRLAGLAGATITHSGLTVFDAAKVGDGAVDVAAWGSDAATAGAVLKVDLGASGAREFNWCRVFTLAGGGTAQWKVQWSDDDSVWNDAQENILLTDVAGWKHVRLAGNGAHRYWRLRLENTPGAGPEFSELEFYESEVNRAQLIVAANVCDQDVSLLAGGTEKRYTINGSFSADAAPAEIISGMLGAMAGWDAETGSGWMVYPGAYIAPTVTLTKADLREADEPVVIRAARELPELFNTVQGVFAGPVTDWQPAGAPVVPAAGSSAAGYLVQDGGVRLAREVQLPFTTSAARAQRISQIALEANRRQIGVSWRGKWSAWRVEGGQTVGITLPEAGWTNKAFVVRVSNLVQEESKGAEGEPANEGLILGVDLDLEEIDANVFAWTAATDEQAFNAPPTVTAPPVPLAVTGFVNNDPNTGPFVLGDPWHTSAVREPATVARSGNTSSGSFVTVSQFDIELSPLQASYKAKNLTVSVASGVRPSQSSGAGSASNVAGAGVDWTNPSNALGSDDAYATAALGASGGSDSLRIDFSGFSIPGGAVLKGFELTIERSKTGSGDIEDNRVQLQESGTSTGDEKAAFGVLWPASDASRVYGGPADLWNTAGITVADLNNGIVGCLIEAAETGGVSAATARVDAVTFKVFYDEFVAEARVKIGAQVSSVLTVTGPTTSAGPEDRDVTGLTPGTTVTVEVQARMAAGTGTATGAIDQKRMTPQHRDHFAT